MGKTEDGNIVMASGTTFLRACRFQCLLIFGIIILPGCKAVVLANKQLDKFFCFSCIVVYIRIAVQTNVPFCGNMLGGIRWCFLYNGGTCSPFVSRRFFFY